MRVLGIDPGLRNLGWGVIDVAGSRLSHVANGIIRSEGEEMGERLLSLHEALTRIVAAYAPTAAAAEQTFVNKDGAATLKLGQARGVCLLAAARGGLEVGEYAARLVKKAVVGIGNAEKTQVHAMVTRLLPGVKISGSDAADALAVAITHAHHIASARRIG